MNTDGSNRQQLSHEDRDISGFSFSPDEQKVLLIMDVPSTTSIQANDADLPLASGMVINDLMYKHWDQYVKAIPHPFVAEFTHDRITQPKDLLEGEPYECPMLPLEAFEQLAWSS